MKILNKKHIILCIFLIFITNTNYSQNETYNQFWGGFTLNGSLTKKWTTEFDFRTKFSSQLDSSNLFYATIQESYSGWAHYYGGARWKFSGGIGYFDNAGASSIDLSSAPEWRFSLQSTYYINKIGNTLSTRMRLETRDTKDSHGDYSLKFRYRQQIKFLKPFNSQLLRKGVYYGFATDELFFQTNANKSVLKFFNRNRFTVGAGYLITDDFHIEASYINDYQPTESFNHITNIISVSIIYNNLGKKIITNFKEKFQVKQNNELD